MKLRAMLLPILFFVATSIVSRVAIADPHSAPHAGQMDTDGILSPGEIPNPDIDYDKAQRHGEKHGDETDGC